MDYATRMADIVDTVNGNRDNLYKTLADVYKYGLEAYEAEDAFHKYAKAQYGKQKPNAWKHTDATKNNLYTAVVRLAFNAENSATELARIIHGGRWV